MIDLHCHLLPGVDDGARTMEDALTLAEAAVANGVKASVLTPHVYPGVFDNRLSTLRPVYEEYRDALTRAGIALDVHLGGEVHLHPDAFELLEADDLPMIGGMDGLKVMLLEFPDGSIPPGSDVACRMFADQGIRWLIAHPERNKAVMRDPTIIKPFLDMGCMLQLTAASVIGAFGRAAAQTANVLLTRGWAHVVASDAHNLAHRPPRMHEAREHLMQNYGMGMAFRLTEENPARILNGRRTWSEAMQTSHALVLPPDGRDVIEVSSAAHAEAYGESGDAGAGAAGVVDGSGTGSAAAGAAAQAGAAGHVASAGQAGASGTGVLPGSVDDPLTQPGPAVSAEDEQAAMAWLQQRGDRKGGGRRDSDRRDQDRREQ